jgi:hypothetical protein
MDMNEVNLVGDYPDDGLAMHQSGGYVAFTKEGADLFA